MSEQPRTRQELYDLVRQRGKDEFILEEMIRLGFWPAEGTIPEDPADDIRETVSYTHLTLPTIYSV